jgi:hypothetical protein
VLWLIYVTHHGPLITISVLVSGYSSSPAHCFVEHIECLVMLMPAIWLSYRLHESQEMFTVDADRGTICSCFRDTWKGYFPQRDLVALSAAPLLVYPTHYTGEKGYVSDTEDSTVIKPAPPSSTKEDL